MLRILGLLCLALALAVLGWEVSLAGGLDNWRLLVFGEVAFRLAPDWLNLIQAVIQRYVTAWLWDPVIQTILLWPAWPVLGGLGLLFLAISRLRRRRRRR